MYMLLMHIALVIDLHTYTDPFDETQECTKIWAQVQFLGSNWSNYTTGFLFIFRALQKLVKGRKISKWNRDLRIFQLRNCIELVSCNFFKSFYLCSWNAFLQYYLILVYHTSIYAIKTNLKSFIDKYLYN